MTKPVAKSIDSRLRALAASLTDMFGLVMLEAMACGLPVAAFPVAGSKDLVRDNEVGALDWDLGKAIDRAIALPRAACRLYAQNFSWEAATQQFLANLAPLSPAPAA